jgi:simple sugar transport system ATP-binding protein
LSQRAPILEAVQISKSYGAVSALADVSLQVLPGEVNCLLGDNGAGKSTLIQILSGVLQPDRGEVRIDGSPVELRSAYDALNRGIATVYQDLAIVAVMPIYRNFFLGREPTTGRGPLRRFDIRSAKRTTELELRRFGIDFEDISRPIGTLSGGERQCVAIARAVYFGARALILDEPTSALGVREAELVLRYVREAKASGIGVIFITHNVHHAYPIGDSFTILKRGRETASFQRGDLTLQELMIQMAGGEDLERLG